MEDVCGHRCPAHPERTPCRLPLGHPTVAGHRDNAGHDVSHVWQDDGHNDSPARRMVRSITYEHDGDRYEVTVGTPRKVYRRRTGPRGGYIKNAGQQSWSTETGSAIARIEAGDPFYVWSEAPSLGWANPSLVGQREIRHIDYFNDAPAGATANES